MLMATAGAVELLRIVTSYAICLHNEALNQNQRTHFDILDIDSTT